MLHKINLPIATPWSKLVEWEKFGDEYDSIPLIRKHISVEALNWLESVGLKAIGCNMLTIFPDKTPPMFINAEWCQTDNHAKLYWVYDVPVRYTWYNFKFPLGVDNQDFLVTNAGEYEESKFKDAPTGWAVHPDAIEFAGSQLIMPGEVALVNIGTPHKFEVTSAARSKVFSIGVESVERFVSRTNGIPFELARDILCTVQT